MKLRPDQVRAICEIRASFDRGKQSPCFVLPTGGGKTAILLSYIDQHEPNARIVWLEPRAALVDQVRNSAKAWMRDTTNLQVTTVQAILASNDPPPKADLCIVDEAHYFYGGSIWANVAHHYLRRIGATATPTRADGKALDNLSDDLIIGLSRAMLTRLKILPPIVTYAPRRRRSTESMPPWQAYLEKTPGERAIVFCGSIEHAETVAQRFRDAGVRAGCSNNPGDLEAHKAGDLEVLTNVFMIAVGYDDPTVTVAILARPFGNASTMLQAIGRARGIGAKRVAVLDLYGAVHEWGLPEEDRIYSLKGTPIKVKKSNTLEICECCGSAYRPSPFTVECSLCRAPVERFKTPIEKKRAAMEALRKAETMQAKRSYFVKNAMIGKSIGKPWLAKVAYKKRYNVGPPFEWLEEFGLE